MMSDETLALFYQEAGNREWSRILSSKPPDKILPDDFAHCEFCAAVARLMLINALANDISSSRYWAGVQLYLYWQIERKFPCEQN